MFFSGLPENLRIGTDRLVRSLYRQREGCPLVRSRGCAMWSTVSPTMRDVLDEVPAPPLSPAERNFYLRLPSVDPRIPRTGSHRRWFSGGRCRPLPAPSSATCAPGFTYTLDGFSATPRDPLAHFLFVRKKGYCEYFASAMAVMLRELSIPSRVATGFLGGVPNPPDQVDGIAGV